MSDTGTSFDSNRTSDSKVVIVNCETLNSIFGEKSEIRSHIDDPVNITTEEANAIALSQADSDGFDSTVLWSEGETKIALVYSIKCDRDIKI